MASIKLLDESIINKIAAGEVVENPKSIIKEMVENSLDANATKITIEIKDGGKELIRISDNGSGIEREYIETAFLRHATSKISKASDLEEIYTLGFRGEALSSISAVSKVELITKTENSITGTRLKIEGGKVLENSECGCNIGTTFTVCDLFYNVPARKKFLKKTTIESSNIYDLVNNLALCRPDVAFKLISNGSTILQTSGNGNLQHVLFQIYGKNIIDNIYVLDYKDDLLKLSGLIADPTKNNRAVKKYGSFFLNGRFIKSDLMYDAVKEALGDNLMNGKYPIFCLNVEINAKDVDVNVHPNKLEVRFSNDRLIYDTIFEAVKNLFTKNSIFFKEKIITEIETKKEEIVNKPNNVFYEDIEKTSNLVARESGQEHKIEFETIKEPIKEEIKTGNVFYDDYSKTVKVEKSKDEFKPIKNNTYIIEETRPKNKDIYKKDIIIEKIEIIPEVNFKFIGQLFNTYCIIEKENSIFLIDQHAAHEKVTYEKILKQFKNSTVQSQILLQPLSVVTNDIETEYILNNLGLFKNFGFEIQEFGKNTFAIRGVPVIFGNPVGIEFFNDLLDLLLNENKQIKNIYDLQLDKIANIACKASVKANNYLDEKEVKDLIKNMLQLESPNTCPHGRPTMIEITKKEVEKLFKRIL